MILRKSVLSSSEMDILAMVHDLYGKKHHHYRECFENKKKENLIFIKNRKGEAQFTVNLSLLAKIQNIFSVQLKEKHLMPERLGRPHLLEDEQEAALAPQPERIAS